MKISKRGSELLSGHDFQYLDFQIEKLRKECRWGYDTGSL